MYDAIMTLRGAAGMGAMLKLGDLRRGLWAFSSPAPRSSDPDRPVCDHGISHFCIELTDIEAHCDRAGARFQCLPPDFFGRATPTYGRDPDGNIFELLEAAAAAEPQ